MNVNFYLQNLLQSSIFADDKVTSFVLFYFSDRYKPLLWSNLLSDSYLRGVIVMPEKYLFDCRSVLTIEV